MNPIEMPRSDTDPVWDSFSIDRVDFRPHWAGDLVNLASVVEPLESALATELLMSECARAMASWVLSHRRRFGSQDRFQIIVGWPKHIRTGNRQTIKTGGTYDDLSRLADGRMPIEMRRGWSNGIFRESPECEQAVDLPN